MFEVPITPRSTKAFRDVLQDRDHQRLEASLARLGDVLGGRRLWHVNSTARGGGVAEMLTSLLSYAAGAGIDVHWLVVAGGDEFFELTKRIHNRLHEDDGDEGPLGAAECAAYDEALEPERAELVKAVGDDDVVILHDPQTAGLIRSLRDRPGPVIWRCHIGVDEPGPLAQSAWVFLEPDVRAANLCVFSRESYAWDVIPRDQTRVIPPCIDVMSPKNHPLDDATVAAILDASGIVPSESASAEPSFVGSDGEQGRVQSRAHMTQEEAIPEGSPLVLQVSRWDRLKDHMGVMQAFARYVAPKQERARLVLAGPETNGVDDDPESAETLKELSGEWEALDDAIRRRVHLARLPMDDDNENSAMVNALQRRADVVAQKSLAEGFGLTVAEAMWKERPVVASGVGGIQDQIVDGESGILLDDPEDHEAFGAAVVELLDDPAHAERIGVAARERVCDCFLPLHHFENEADAIASVLE